MLFDRDGQPVVIDFSPYLRPARYADAIVVGDAMLWEGAGVETLDVLGDNELSRLYWEENGGITFRDPDGRGVIYASWVYVRDRQPSESPQ